MHPDRSSRAVARDHTIELIEPRPHAGGEQQALLVRAQVVGQLVGHGSPELSNLGIAVDGLDHLLCAERDQDADDDDSDFTGELAPAVQRFW